MKAGKILAIIGAIVAIVSVGLSFVLPTIFGWYRIELSAIGISAGIYFTGIGSVATTGGIGGISGFATLELIGGILLIIGAIICIVGVIKESKVAGIVGGVLILLGPLILIIDLLIGFGDFADLIQTLGGPSNASVFWGSFTITGPPDILMSWGIWIGTFMAIGGGVVGLIGGAMV